MGERFPSLTLETKGYQAVRVPEDFLGKNLLLAWFPLAFSPVCTEELRGLNRVHAELAHLGATVLGVSVDHWYSNEAFRERLGAQFPIVSDWRKENARRLGILLEERGVSRRVLYLLDREGVLRWKREYELRECPRSNDFLPEVERLA